MSHITYVGVKNSDVLYLFPLTRSADKYLDHPVNQKYVRNIRTCGELSTERAIVLSMEMPPKSFETGWVFGGNMQTDDVFLGADARFSVGFNQKSGILLITNHSKNDIFIHEQVGADSSLCIKPRRLNSDTGLSSILERRNRIELPDCTLLAVIPRNSDDQEYQKLLVAGLKSSFQGYYTPITPPEDGSTICSGYSLRNVVRKADPSDLCHVDILVAVRITTGDKFIAKRFLKRENNDHKEHYFLNLLESFKHDNVIRLEDLLETTREICLVLPASPSGDLSQHDCRRWSETQKTHAALQILSGTEFLHRYGIFHRDIKPSNLLLFADNPILVKIADLGSTTLEEMANDMVGTENFAAPEVMLAGATGVSPYQTDLVDVWSIGVVLMTFYNAVEQFRRMSRELQEDYHKVLATLASCCSKSKFWLPWLLSCMVKAEPKDRLTIAQCLRLCQGTWDKLMEELEVLIPAQPTESAHSLAPTSIDLASTVRVGNSFASTDPDTAPRTLSPALAEAGSIRGSFGTPEVLYHQSACGANTPLSDQTYENLPASPRDTISDHSSHTPPPSYKTIAQGEEFTNYHNPDTSLLTPPPTTVKSKVNLGNDLGGSANPLRRSKRIADIKAAARSRAPN
ncbi:hypothetical protein TWF281_006602 [Arthrobotrys megalospora]